MKKINKLLITTLTTVIFITSCSNPLLRDPRLYNQANKNVTQNNDSSNGDDSLNEEDFEIPEEKPQAPVDPNNIDPKDITNFDRTDYWFNEEDCNSYSNENKNNISFPASEFDQLSLHAKFVEGNIPVYSFTKKTNPWEKENAIVYRDKTHGNTTAYGAGKHQNVTGVSILQYRGVNPANNAPNYRESYTKIGFPLLKRFYFYRFQGSAPMGIVLDNYLIAIDTYSKFIFAFAKPDPSKLGLMDAPGAVAKGGWLPIDTAEKRFYMYDPVGYVQKTGENNYEVVLYDWFKQNLTAGKYEGVENYKDSIDDTKIAKKTPDGAGQSPFAAKLSEFEGTITIPTRSFSSSVKNNEYAFRDENGNGLNKITLKFDETGKNVTIAKTPWGQDSTSKTFTVQESTEDSTRGSITINGNVINLKIDDVVGLMVNETLAVKMADFKDLGPSFENRVKNNPKYESADGKISYEFINGHKQLKLNGEIYEYDTTIPGHNGRDKVGYSRNTWALSYDIIGVTLQENDKIIKMTEVYNIKKNLKWDKLINQAQKVDKLSGKTFFDVVKGQTYSFRELAGYSNSSSDGQGYGLNLYTYEFTPDGTSVTFKTTDWSGKTVPEDKTYNVVLSIADKTKALIEINENEKIKLSLNDAADKLFVNNDTYIHNFKDLGPSFENRLLEARSFANGEKSATLSVGLDTLEWTEPNWIGKTTTYTYSKINPEPDQPRDYLIYKNGDGTFFYKVKVKGKGTKEDPVSICMSTGGRSWANVKGDTTMTEWLVKN